ncbi:hypothetical protein H8E77_09885 [bacterium]|nr:hypothetical protein [bacterium]
MRRGHVDILGGGYVTASVNAAPRPVGMGGGGVIHNLQILKDKENK